MPYQFGETKFEKFVWLNAGDVLKNPRGMEIEMANAGAFGLELYGENGALKGKAQRSNENGLWSTFDFKRGGEFGAGIPSGDYRIKLVNLSPGIRNAKQGQIWFEED